MKCPKCSLVTFDYLSKCPRCDTSFELSRRLTRRRTDPKRRILIASTASGDSSVADAPVASLAMAPEVDHAHVRDLPPDGPRTVADVTTTPPAEVPPVDLPSLGEAPSLHEMAATEQREDLAVNVAAAVAAARAAIQGPEESTAPPAAATATAVPATTHGEGPQDESTAIKERMMRASRARRKERPDRVTESTDPVLPDWYEPDVDEPNGAARSASDSTDR